MKRVLVLALIGAFALSCAVAWRATGPSLRRFPYLVGPAGSQTGEFLLRDVQVEADVSLRVAVRPPRAAREWWVFFPGNDAQQLAQGVEFLRRVAGERDVGLATFAYRGFDGSQGEPSPETAGRDGVKVLESLGVPADQLTVIAYSLGAPVAVSSLLAWQAQGKSPVKLVLLSGASELAMLWPAPWAPLSRGDEWRVEGLEALRCPVTVLHGEEDTTLPPSMAWDLAARVKAQPVVLPKLDHVGVLRSAPLAW